MQFVDTNLTDKNPVDACHINPVHVLNKAILSQLWINKALTVYTKTFTKNWVNKQSFFVFILTTAHFFLGINLFCFSRLQAEVFSI